MLDPARAIDRLRATYGGPDGYRTPHAKGAFYAGTFTATPEAKALDPTRIVDGIDFSDDPILRYRPAAYSESVARRAAGPATLEP